MTKIHCRTNIDCAKRLTWPTELPERPMIGDYIRSTSSERDWVVELKVIQTTWIRYYDHVSKQDEWTLEVELHLPPHRYQDIEHFENHVRKKYHWA